MHIRALTVDDAPAYHAFRLEGLRLYPDAFRSSYEDDVKKSVEWAKQRIITSSDNPYGFTLAAFETDAANALIIGTIVLETNAKLKTQHTGLIISMLVAHAHAGKGVASALLAELIVKAQQIETLEMLHLTVTATNDRAIKLYERFGFTREGIERWVMKVGERYFDKLHMSLLLSDMPEEVQHAIQMRLARNFMFEHREALSALAKL